MDPQSPASASTDADSFGLPEAAFAKAVGISIDTLRRLPASRAPRTASISQRHRRVLESPREWLQRIAEQQHAGAVLDERLHQINKWLR
jgi:hypothetical protein